MKHNFQGNVNDEDTLDFSTFWISRIIIIVIKNTESLFKHLNPYSGLAVYAF